MHGSFIYESCSCCKILFSKQSSLGSSNKEIKMANATQVIPSLAEFYKIGLISAPVPEDGECNICLDPFETNEEAVLLNPCNHLFHRRCLCTWFKNQLLHVTGYRNIQQEYGTCPMDRSKLFDAIGVDAATIIAHSWVQTLYELKGTQFEALGQEALDRIHNAPQLSLVLVDDVVSEMVRQDNEYAATAIEHGVLPAPPPPRPQIILITERYQIAVDAADGPNHQFINDVIRGDVQSLAITADQHMPYDLLQSRQQINWITMIVPICQSWFSSGYPRSRYITEPSLHRLVICSLLVDRVGRLAGHSSTVGYAQLLAHGESMLLQAQLRATSGTVNDVERLEHRRVLDWQPTDVASVYGNSRDPLTFYPGNFARMQWIILLRQKTRGLNADPMTS